MNVYKQLYKITSKEDFKPFLTGVFHRDGKLIASNGHVLAIVKYKYSSDLEGVIVSKNGENIDAKYPNIDKIYMPSKASKGRLDSRFFKSAEKLRGVKNAYLRFGESGFSISVKYILLIKDLMSILGEYPDSIRFDSLEKGIFLESFSVKALVMPSTRDDLVYDYDMADAYVKKGKLKNWYEK